MLNHLLKLLSQKAKVFKIFSPTLLRCILYNCYLYSHEYTTASQNFLLPTNCNSFVPINQPFLYSPASFPQTLIVTILPQLL